jgi:3-hydroxyacyl-CoA dehydrogenase / enoyl-CoA hydratase / 3-hydroxybutyryl-CoA epimerase
MPVGGLQLMDETSIDLGVKIAQQSKAALGDAYPHDAADAVLIRLLAEGRLGRKNGKGFYDYGDNGRRLGLWNGFADIWPPQAPQPDSETVENRLILVQVLEAVRALEQGVLGDVREGDVAAVLGWGFAPWSGGPFGWVDAAGAAAVVALCDDLAARHGARFAAPALLRSMAAAGARFYPADAAAALHSAHGRLSPGPPLLRSRNLYAASQNQRSPPCPIPPMLPFRLPAACKRR